MPGSSQKGPEILFCRGTGEVNTICDFPLVLVESDPDSGNERFNSRASTILILITTTG